MEEKLKQQIQEMIDSSKVFLFMKGTPEEPECGFSAKVVEILKNNKTEFKSFNILSNEDIRQGIKEFSNWPTLPQLYIDGKFVGGCDIVVQMGESGELKKLLTP